MRVKKGDPIAELRIRVIDYKDEKLLSRFISERGKILPRRLSGMTARHQRRPRPGYRPAYGYRGYYPYYGYRGYYPYYGYRGYYPWYGYAGYYPGFYLGIGAYYGPGYYSTWPYAAYGYSYDSGYGSSSGGASLKIEVKPKSAEVYVDGHFAGIVDQFDGMFDSLPLEAGDHEITIYQEGFRSIRQRLYLSPSSTYRIKGTLEPLAPGEGERTAPAGRGSTGANGRAGADDSWCIKNL